MRAGKTQEFFMALIYTVLLCAGFCENKSVLLADFRPYVFLVFGLYLRVSLVFVYPRSSLDISISSCVTAASRKERTRVK